MPQREDDRLPRRAQPPHLRVAAHTIAPGPCKHSDEPGAHRDDPGRAALALGIVAHARLALTLADQAGRDPRDVLADLASFYFDTALSASPTVLPSLLAFARPDHILFGSDWPFAPAPVVGYFTNHLDQHPQLDAAQRRAIDSGNALALFPRLAPGPGRRRQDR